MFAKSIIAATFMVGAVVAQSSSSASGGSYPTVATSAIAAEVSAATKASWCNGQQNSCTKLCTSGVLTNTCNPTQLTYVCTCNNGTSPGLQYYADTIDSYTCNQAFSDCIAANPNNQAGQDQCTTNIKNRCGNLNANSYVAASSSATATSAAGAAGAGAGTSTAAGGSSTTATAASGSASAATATATSSSRAAAVPTAMVGNGVIGVTGAGILAVLAYAL